jgi:hypothetical protein
VDTVDGCAHSAPPEVLVPMNGWEFAANLITKAYWPLIVGILIFTQRRSVSRLIDRIRKGTGPGGVGFEADPSRLLAEAVEDAVESAEAVGEVVAGSRDEEQGRQAATEERRREIQEVAKRAAEWGQYYWKNAQPLGPDEYWEPELRWAPDGSVQIFIGRRATRRRADMMPFEVVKFPTWPPSNDAESNESRQG